MGISIVVFLTCLSSSRSSGFLLHSRAFLYYTLQQPFLLLLSPPPFNRPLLRRIESRKTDLLNVIIRQRAPIFQLLPGKDQTLLVRRDALLVLDLGLDIVDGVGGFDLERDGFAREGFYEADLESGPLWVGKAGTERLTSALWLRVEVSMWSIVAWGM